MSWGMVLRIADWAEVLELAPKNCPKTTMPKEARCQAHAAVSASFDISSSKHSRGVAYPKIFLGKVFIQS
ncbi:hypothetical protein LMUR_13999 [Listeria grayi FSL F6-1183]|uniref:Uncharacterized protein n=1 Tax=Listeria grayi FSL F6-1183 TaxID=1265827 RepID=A0A829R549_LISGR|nr:hypothetical protein LMUR_13999 [Listeria grayi FSL F6-1183]